MAEEVDTENEKKGTVYEAFVNVAFNRVIKQSLEWEVNIPGVIANQDFVYPKVEKPNLVMAITHWGSHEAANKKFWRTLEDRFEVYDAFPRAKFVSVLFEMPIDSDIALEELLRIACNGRGLSEINSKVISSLQKYVDDDDKVISFGSGKNHVLDVVEKKCISDKVFCGLIDKLGIELKSLISSEFPKYSFVDGLLNKIRVGASKRTASAYISRFKNTYYKAGLIGTLFFSPDEMAIIFEAINQRKLKSLPKNLTSRLESLKLVKVTKIGGAVTPDKSLVSLATIPIKEYLAVRQQFSGCVDDPASTLHFCKDHFCDLTDPSRRGVLLKYLKDSTSVEGLINAETGVGSIVTQRVWVVDYFCAIKRNFTRAKEYGIRKLSNTLGFEYKGGGVSSPIPVYSRGVLNRLTASEKKKLYSYILKEKNLFDWSKVNGTMIAVDRMTTMKKKFDVIELMISNALGRGGVKNAIAGFRVKNPLRSNLVDAGAGVTTYNFKIEFGMRSVLLFVVSSYDATHKHKELSGRVRLSDISDELHGKQHKNIIVLDGTVFDSEPRSKLKMLSVAGWDAIFYVDELDVMTKAIAEYLEGKSDDVAPRRKSVVGRFAPSTSLPMAAGSNESDTAAVEDEPKGYGKT